jgi:hypothetical protein
MPAERPPGGDDPAEVVAHVAAAKREVLLRVNRHRLRFEDLEDCFSQATLELVLRARTRARAFVSEAHVANALEQRFLSRISDRQRALGRRSPIQAATHDALRQPIDQDGGDQDPPVAALADPTADVAARLAGRDDVRRLRELAEELTADQRLVLACLGFGAAKLGVTALCVAGAAGGYVVCDQIGVLSGPLPRERHQIATSANAVRKAPRTRRAPSPAVTRTPAPIAHTIRQPPATATSGAHHRSSGASASSSNQASSEFGSRAPA